MALHIEKNLKIIRQKQNNGNCWCTYLDPTFLTILRTPNKEVVKGLFARKRSWD
jgi:hypothetical protein